MLSYWPCQRLNVAAAACSSSTFGTGCSPWSTDWLPLLSLSPCRGVVLNRGLKIAGIVRCVGGSRRCRVAACSPRRCVCRLGLLVCSSAGGPSCHLPSASVDLSLRRRGWVRSFQRGHGEGGHSLTVSLSMGDHSLTVSLFEKCAVGGLKWRPIALCTRTIGRFGAVLTKLTS